MFRVGDRVRRRTGINVGQKYNGLTLLKEMYDDCQYGVIINEVVRESPYTYYHLTGSRFVYSEPMLELVVACDFKVGDIVRIKSDLRIGMEYGEIHLLDSMSVFRGRRATISRITSSGNFELKEIGYIWSSEMLERAEPYSRDLEGSALKFLVLKLDDIKYALSEYDKRCLDRICANIQSYRAGKNKSTRNEYLVVNRDESYAPEIENLMKSRGHWGA